MSAEPDGGSSGVSRVSPRTIEMKPEVVNDDLGLHPLDDAELAEVADDLQLALEYVGHAAAAET